MTKQNTTPSQDPAADLRWALRRLAKAVVVISCRHEGVRYAMAATAVSELSMDPPSMLICVNRSASIHAPLTAGADFCLNILHSSQGDISANCSGRLTGEDRFAIGAWSRDDGPLLLTDAQANIVCRNERQIEHGSHTIFIGAVEAARRNGEVDPLVYVDGKYMVVHPPEAAEAVGAA